MQQEKDKGIPGFGGEAGGRAMEIATITDFSIPDAVGRCTLTPLTRS
jgi:hypothetical protein